MFRIGLDFLFMKFLETFQEEIQFELLSVDEKLIIQYEKREEELSDFMNDFLINKTNIIWDKNGELKIPPSIFIQKFLEILKEYLNYTKLKYFSIPVIGKISSGKSTFLNSLLGIDCLESSSKITTKFICIIRHNKDNKTPRLFPVILQKRKSEINKNAYNFIKDEKNEIKGDLKENIRQINKKIEECGNLYGLNKKEFFYILEANLDIFKGDNFVYSKMFEFLDIPGLNEITEFYLKEIIPLITPNTHFSIFLFDAGGSEDEGSKVLFNKFLHLMNSKAKKNSFFIYNKLDIFKKGDNLEKLKENEDLQLLYFKNEILFRDYNLKLKHNHLVGLDSIQLKYDKKKGTNFGDYILSFIQRIPKFDNKKFTILFKNKMKEEFNVTKFNVKDELINENKTDDDENLLNLVNDALKVKYYSEIDIGYLIKMKIIFNDYKKNHQENESKEDKFSELYKNFNKSFKDTVDDFVGNHNLKILIKTFNTLLIRLYELSTIKEEKENIKHIIIHMLKHFESFLYPNFKIQKLEGIDDDLIRFRLNNFEYEIKNIFDWNKEIIQSLNKNLVELEVFNSDIINKMATNVKNVINYLDNRKIRITITGPEFSGKSSIINNIIGNYILPLHEKNKNSNINLIIQSSINNKIELFNAKIKLIDNYCIFEKGNGAIATGYDNVKNKLIELKSKETDFENSCYILNTPIEFFKIIKVSDEILSRIEIIYLSGKYINNLVFGANKNLEAIIKYSDNFVFLEKENNLSEQSFLFLKKFIFFISTINNSFNLEKFLFIINKCSKNDLIETIIKPLKNFMPKVCWFSIKEYENFINIRELVKNEEKFFKYVINKIKTQGKNKLIDNILNEINSMQKLKIKSVNIFFRRLIINTYLDFILSKPKDIIQCLNNLLKDEGISEEDLKKKQTKIIKIAEEFNILQNSIYNHASYYDSNAEIFLSEIYNLFFNVKFYLDYNLKITIENTKDYLKSIFNLINKKILETDKENNKYFFSNNNEENRLLNNFENFFNEFKKNISDELEKYRNKCLTKIGNLYGNKSNLSKNIDKILENEEKLFFEVILERLSKYNEKYENFKKNNKQDDIFIHSKIFINDYNRGNINKDSIKSEFKFGWFLFYNIKNKIKSKFLLPQSICYLFKNANLSREQNEKYYEFKCNGLKYFINCILEDIHFDMKNNLEHIIQFKSEQFEKVNEKVNDFIKVCIDLYDLFDEDEDDEENKDDDLKNN